jgi:hypothetical protein
VKEMDVHDEMMRIFEAQEEELRNIRDIGDYLNEDVLEIKREQTLGSDGWNTTHYTLVTGLGGPYVEFDTQYHIHVYWGGDKIESCTYDNDVRSIIDEIEEWLNELY